MKKIILSALVALTLSTQANAFVPYMEFQVNSNFAIARVWNNTFNRIVCSGYAYGRTWQGFVGSAWVNNVVLMPNTFIDVHVTSGWNDPMAQAWAQMNCESIW